MDEQAKKTALPGAFAMNVLGADQNHVAQAFFGPVQPEGPTHARHRLELRRLSWLN